MSAMEAAVGGELSESPVAGALSRRQVGDLLRSARLGRGLEVEDVAERLKLRSSFVTAVEDGRGNEHMDESYEWSHIRSIAGMLNVELEGRG